MCIFQFLVCAGIKCLFNAMASLCNKVCFSTLHGPTKVIFRSNPFLRNQFLLFKLEDASLWYLRNYESNFYKLSHELVSLEPTQFS
jgi:hypothetical protein